MVLVFSDIQAVFAREGDAYRMCYAGSGLRWRGRDFFHIIRTSRDRLGDGIRKELEGSGMAEGLLSDLPTPIAVDGDLYARNAAPYSLSDGVCWSAAEGIDADAAIISSSILSRNPSGSAAADTVGFLSCVRKVAVDLSDGIFIDSQELLDRRIRDLQVSGKDIIVSGDEEEIRRFLQL